MSLNIPSRPNLPESSWTRYSNASDLLSALSTDPTWRVWLWFFGGVTEIA